MASRATSYRRVAPARLDQRETPRRAVLVSRASVRKLGDTPTVTRLIDLSRYGCRLDATIAAEAGDRLRLRFEGGAPMAASVIWVDAGQMGVRFDEALPADVYRALTLDMG